MFVVMCKLKYRFWQTLGLLTNTRVDRKGKTLSCFSSSLLTLSKSKLDFVCCKIFIMVLILVTLVTPSCNYKFLGRKLQFIHHPKCVCANEKCLCWNIDWLHLGRVKFFFIIYTQQRYEYVYFNFSVQGPNLHFSAMERSAYNYKAVVSFIRLSFNDLLTLSHIAKYIMLNTLG
jgi:hypothetical protein